MSQLYRVATEHRRAYPDPLWVRAGDPLVLGEEDEEFPGWIWATDPEDRGGWAPVDLGDPDSGLARYDYSAAELDASIGDPLILEERKNGWAWCVKESGESGWIPLANLEPLS